MDSRKKHDIPNPRRTANIISRIVFWWLNDLFGLGSSRDLGVEDLYNTLPIDQSQALGDRLQRNWSEEIKNAERKKQQPSLQRAIVKTFWKAHLISGVCFLLYFCVFRISQALFLLRLVASFISEHEVSTGEKCLYAVGMLVSAAACMLILLHALLGGQQTGMRVKIACCSLIYRKILHLSVSSLGQTKAGEVINLLSNDVNRFDPVGQFNNCLWVTPIQVVIVTYLLWQFVGMSALIGVATLLIMTVPVQLYMAKLNAVLRLKVAVRIDKRVGLMSEIISGIRLIKMYAWEKPFHKMVQFARKYELGAVRSITHIRSFNYSSVIFTERIALLVTLLPYVLQGHQISAGMVFAIANLLNALQMSLAFLFPVALQTTAECQVSIRRLQNFLLKEEMVMHPTIKNGSGPNSKTEDRRREVFISEASARWVPNATFDTLANVSLDVRPGTLCAVVGPVGSGKSSLLQLLLGELPLSSGTMSVTGEVSYCCQKPWLFDSSVYHNILFGQPYNAQRYQDVVTACALLQDFNLLPQGDKTIVGERGFSLSGGQRSRINLARTIYRSADIYLLDDPLSAVDAHISKHLFDKCIKSFLANKTCILATNQMQHLQDADWIVVLDKGKVLHQGTFSELVANQVSFNHLLTSNNDIIDTEETEGSGDRAGKIADQQDEEGPTQEEEDERAELLAKSTIKGSIFLHYISAGVGRCKLLLLLVIFLLCQLSSSGSDFWLSYWTNQEQLRNHHARLFESSDITHNTSLKDYSYTSPTLGHFEMKGILDNLKYSTASPTVGYNSSQVSVTVQNVEYSSNFTTNVNRTLTMLHSSILTEEVTNSPHKLTDHQLDKDFTNQTDKELVKYKKYQFMENTSTTPLDNITNYREEKNMTNNSNMKSNEFVSTKPEKDLLGVAKEQNLPKSQEYALTDYIKTATKQNIVNKDNHTKLNRSTQLPEKIIAVENNEDVLHNTEKPTDNNLTNKEEVKHLIINESAVVRRSAINGQGQDLTNTSINHTNNKIVIPQTQDVIKNIESNIADVESIGNSKEVQITTSNVPHHILLPNIISSTEENTQLMDKLGFDSITGFVEDGKRTIPTDGIASRNQNVINNTTSTTSNPYDKTNTSIINEHINMNNTTKTSDQSNMFNSSQHTKTNTLVKGAYKSENKTTISKAIDENASTGSNGEINITHYQNSNTTAGDPKAPTPIQDSPKPLLDSLTCLWIYTGCILICVTIVLLRSMLFVFACLSSSQGLHEAMFKGVLGAPMRFFDINPSGRILNRFSKDIGAVDDIIPENLLMSIQIGLVAAGILVLVLIENYWMLIPIILGVLLFYNRTVVYFATAPNVKRLEGITRSPVFSHVSATLDGLTTIRASGTQELVQQEFESLQDLHTSAFELSILTPAAFGFWTDCITLTFTGCLTFSFILFGKDLAAGDVGLAISQTLILLGMLNRGVYYSTLTANQLVAVERILQYADIEREPGLDPNSGHRAPTGWPSSGAISFQQIDFKYSQNGVSVLQDFNLAIKPAQKVGIVGRTGSGKSSIINALIRMATVEGSVYVDGLDTRALGLYDLRRKISIIPQEPVLFSASLRDNLDPFGAIPDEEIWSALEEVELKDSVSSLDFILNEGGSNFSIGQRQLMCLARAILRNNKIMVLDEATANVDTQTDASIQATIRRKFRDCTVITIAHRLNTIMDSDKVLVMDAGQIMEYDHPHMLLQNSGGYLYRLVQKTGSAMAEQLQQVAEQTYERHLEEEEAAKAKIREKQTQQALKIHMKRPSGSFPLQQGLFQVVQEVYKRHKESELETTAELEQDKKSQDGECKVNEPEQQEIIKPA